MVFRDIPHGFPGGPSHGFLLAFSGFSGIARRAEPGVECLTTERIADWRERRNSL